MTVGVDIFVSLFLTRLGHFGNVALEVDIQSIPVQTIRNCNSSIRGFFVLISAIVVR